MKLSDLIQSVAWDDIAAALHRHYPEDAEKSLSGFHAVWYRMREMTPLETTYRLVTEPLSNTHDEEDLPEGDAPAHTCCREPNDDTNYGIDFSPRAEILGMEVLPSRYDDAEVVAHVLWEVTWHGFDEEDVQQRALELKQQIQDLRQQTPEEREEQQRRSDEFMQEFFPDLWKKQQTK